MFGPAWPQVRRYAELLADAGVTRGLIGPREITRLWERHLLNCAQVAGAFPAGARVCDLGSGPGLPGVVLALARPDLQVSLLEPLLRRTRFLEEVRGELGLDGLEIIRGRAEEHRGAGFDAVVARAVAPLPRLVRWGLPLCRPGGLLLAMKGAGAEEELAAAGAALAKAGARSSRVQELSFSPHWSGALAVEVIAGETVASGKPSQQRPRRRRS